MRNVERERSLLIRYPELASQWDYVKNVGLPEEYSIGSHEEVSWIGKCGHHWQAVIKDRVRGYGCPICAGKRVVQGINDLASCFPNLEKEWDYRKNQGLEPTMVSSKSHKKVFWICKKGHSYEASIDSRARGRGCPYCGRKKVKNGETDLKSQNPFLVSEWDYKKNKDLFPNQVFANSHHKVWWKCSLCNYEWQATIYSRTTGNGCPKCARHLQSSFPEQAIYYYVKQRHSDSINGYREPFNRVMELDIYVPSLNLGIEYDGGHWHTGTISQRREVEKYAICKQEGIRLIRIKEGREKFEDNNCDVCLLASERLDDTIRALSDYLLMPDDIDVERDRNSILLSYKCFLKDNSLVKLYPESKQEWHSSKNGSLIPEMFSPYSNIKVWWVCPCGHEYENVISHQTRGHKCPYCAHRKVLKGYNDLATMHSGLLNEWDYELNAKINLFPNTVMAGSKKKAWWKCARGHHWYAAIYERSIGVGCPFCYKESRSKQ